MDNLLNPKSIKANTLSVVMSPTDSVSCYVEIDESSCNLTLRLEDESARLAGYPSLWRTWDEAIDGDLEGKTYGEAEQDATIESFVDEIEAMDAYVSRETEKEIFSQLRKSLEKQFEDEMFKDQLTQAQKEEVLAKIDLAIKNLS